MKIEKVITGSLRENCYIIGIDDKVLVVDPGDDINKIRQIINNRKVLGILITHRHEDHIGALSYFINTIYEKNNLEEKEYIIDKFKFKTIFTPGHTSDSVSYYFEEENILFSGDFIFYETIGRCDLPTGNYNIMKESINKIKKYPQNTTIYPGHDRETTLEHEINNNIYFKGV